MHITSKFSKELVVIFLSRVSFILNKIHQRRIIDFSSDEFEWHYEEPVEEKDTLDSFITVHFDNGVSQSIFWNGDFDSTTAKIESDCAFLNALDENDNIITFTKMEIRVINKLIDLEKKLLAEAKISAIEFVSRIGETNIPSIADAVKNDK